MSFLSVIRKPFLIRLLKYFLWITVIPIILLVLVLITLQFPQTQNYLVQKTTVYLTKKLKSKVVIGRIGIAFPKSIELSDLYIEDLHKKTLFYCQTFKSGIDLSGLFAKKIVINSIEVEKLNGHIYREFPDTTFNFSFIPSALSTSNADTISKTVEVKSNESDDPLQFSIKDIQLKNIYFTFQDTLSGINAAVKLGSFETDLEKIDLQKNEIHIQSLRWGYSIVKMVQNNPVKIDSTKSNSNSPFNLILDKLELQHISFVYDNMNILQNTEGMDVNHLLIKNFCLNSENLYLSPQKIKLTLNQMNFNEKSGFILKNFSTKLIYDSTHIELADLDLQTNNSRFGNYLSFRFNSLANLPDSIGKVQLKIDLKNTSLALSDIRFFKPEVLKNPDLVQPSTIVINVKANIDGSMDNLHIGDLKISTQKQTLMKVEGVFKNILKPDSMYVDLKSFEFATTKYDLDHILSSKVIPSNITIPSDIKIQCGIIGYMKNFNANLRLKTSFGEIMTKVKMNPSLGNKEQNYVGEIEIINLNLGKLLNQPENLGLVNMKTHIKGSGLNPDQLKAELNVTLANLFFKGYEYKNLVIDGLVNKKSFTGKTTMDDKNLSFNFKGNIDLDETHPKYKFQFDLIGADLKALHFTDEDFKISGSVISDLQVTSGQNIIGRVCMKNWEILNANKNYSLDSMVFISELKNGISNVSIQSKLLTFDYKGNINMTELPKIMTRQLNSYLNIPSISTKENLHPDFFNFEVKLNDITHLAENLIPDLQKLSPIFLKGSYDGKTKNMHLNMNVPNINYSGMSIEGLKFEVNFIVDKLNYSLQISEVSNPEMKIENFYLGGEIQNNRIGFQLNALKDGKIDRLALSLKDKKETVKAMIDGNVVYKNQNNNFSFLSDVFIKDISMNGASVGNLTIHAENREYPKIYKVKLNLSGNENEINLFGNYNAMDSSGKLNFILAINKLSLATIEPFAIGQLSKMSGVINGKLGITGRANSPEISGSVDLLKCGFNATMINSYLKIDDAKIVIDSNKIRFNSFTIFDSLNNKAVLNGFADIHNPSEINFDMYLKTKNFHALNTIKKDNPLYFGTIFLDSDIHILGNQNKPVMDVKVKLNKGTILTYIVPESEVIINKNNGIVEFVDKTSIHKKNITAKKDSIEVPIAITGIDLNATIAFDEEVEFRMILDPVTGDSMFVKGDAILNFSVDQGGTTNLIGKYNISDGGYHMVVNNFVKKDFKIENGSSIAWSGDILNANTDIKTVYRIRVPSVDLMQKELEGMEEGQKVKYQALSNFLVYLNLNGYISAPEISFDLQLPADESESINVSINEKLNQLREDTSQLNMQVFALLTMNKFIALEFSENESENEKDPSAKARATASKVLTNQLTKLSKKYVKGVDLDMGINSYEDFESGDEQGRTELKVGVSKQLFNNRLKVHVGGNLDLENENSDEDVADVSGDEENNEDANAEENEEDDGGAEESDADDVVRDIRLDYKLSKDGSIILKAYKKNVYENPFEGQLTKGGFGVIYTKDYNQLKDLFSKNKK